MLVGMKVPARGDWLTVEASEADSPTAREVGLRGVDDGAEAVGVNILLDMMC